MRRIILLMAVMGAAVLVATGVAMAEATQYKEIVTIPVEATVTNPCNGEPVTLSGEMLAVTHWTFDDNGGIHGFNNLNMQEVSAVGEVSGETYRFVEQHHPQIFAGPLPLEETSTNSFLLISEGSSDNFLLQVTVHYTINANGEVTAEIINFHEECRG